MNIGIRWLLTCLATLMVCPYVGAQQAEQGAGRGAADELPSPEVIDVVTRDQVVLKCLWLPGTQGKETVPVILLHDWDGDRQALADLAKVIQETNGSAVLVPDLRGHGESLYLEGSNERLDRNRWRPNQIAAIINDIEACKRFLVQQNNEGQLNIDLLSVVAYGSTAIHAVQWSINDWQYGYLGGVKQGQDVKSLVLVDPEKTFRRLSLTQNSRNPLFAGPAENALSMMILANADQGNRFVRDVQSIYDQIERLRQPTDDDDTFLYFFEYQTQRQVQVVRNELRNTELPLDQLIAYFIANEAKRFADDHRWQDRSRN